MTDPNKRPLPGGGEIERVPDWSGVWWWFRKVEGLYGPKGRTEQLSDEVGEALWTLADPERERKIRTEAVRMVAPTLLLSPEGSDLVALVHEIAKGIEDAE